MNLHLLTEAFLSGRLQEAEFVRQARRYGVRSGLVRALVLGCAFVPFAVAVPSMIGIVVGVATVPLIALPLRRTAWVSRHARWVVELRRTMAPDLVRQQLRKGRRQGIVAIAIVTLALVGLIAGLLIRERSIGRRNECRAACQAPYDACMRACNGRSGCPTECAQLLPSCVAKCH